MAKSALKPSVVDNTAVTARGLDLLQLIKDGNGLFLTQAEAADEIANGNVEANLQDTQGNRAFCFLTAKGAAALVPAAKSTIEIDNDVPMPEKKKGGRRGSKYPFDELALNTSFHVPKTAANPDPVAALASSLTGARRRFSQPMVDAAGKPVMETVNIKIYQLDDKGKRVKGADGKWIVTGNTSTLQQKTVVSRDFSVAEVGADDKRGPGARVWRTK